MRAPRPHIPCSPTRFLTWWVPVVAVASVIAIAATGCSKIEELAGPTCDQFVTMSEADRKQAVIDWAKAHDARVDDVDPEGKSGVFLFQDLASLMTYCQQTGNGDDRIDSLRGG